MKTLQAFGVALICVACSKSGDDAKPKHSASAPLAASPASPSPNEILDELDQRRALPLLPMMAQHQKQNMREHLEAVQQVVAAAAVGDFDNVAVAAKRLGYSETMGRMCERMGAGAPGFTEQALAFHHTADEIVAAAARRDNGEVLASLSKTLKACTNCHSTHKQQPVANLPQ